MNYIENKFLYIRNQNLMDLIPNALLVFYYQQEFSFNFYIVAPMDSKSFVENK